MFPAPIHRLIFFALLGFCLMPGPAAAEDPPRGDGLQKLRLGASPEEVRTRLGPPARVARQVLHQRILEQWVYDRPHSVRLTFDRPRGEPAALLAIRPLRPGDG